MSLAVNAAPAGRWIEGLSADLSVRDALRLIFRQRWHGVLYYLPLVSSGAEEAVENVHKLRVSCRRLAVVLNVLADELPRAPRKRLSRLAKGIGRSCGKARDLDVRRQFFESLLPHASVEDAGAIELLCEETVVRRLDVQKKLARRLPRLERKLIEAGNDLLAAIASPRHGSGGGERSPEGPGSSAGSGFPAGSGGAGIGSERSAGSSRSFGAIGARALRAELSALWRRAGKDFESSATLHELRIACKHLRYAFEVFMPALDDSFRDDYYPQLVQLQDLLGEMHDAAEATRAVLRRRKQWKRRWKKKDSIAKGRSVIGWRELRSGLDAVVLAYARQDDRARAEFFDLWPGFAGESFRAPVEGALLPLAGDRSSGEAPFGEAP
jgi:CHAD domain-containing protein